jgi:hypothetical protein
LSLVDDLSSNYLSGEIKTLEEYFFQEKKIKDIELDKFHKK